MNYVNGLIKLLISLVISFRILEVFSNSEPGPETLSLDGQKFEE